MEKYYKVIFMYPDGHLEEIDEQFKDGKEALEYGNNLLNQVLHTEDVFHRGNYEDNDFNFNQKKEPRFMIVEVKGKKYRLVYESVRR